MNGFDFLANLPVLVLTFIFFVVFIIFIRGGIILLKAKDDEEREKQGSKILLNSLYGFLTILIVALVFFLVSYLLRKGETLQPQEVSEEFPSSLAVDFPPPPQFINVGEYYFTGPWLLKKSQFIKEAALYTILCKKNEEYDIIYIGQTEGREQLLRHEQYKCWVENCGRNSKDIYLGIFWTPSERYNAEQKKEIKESLKKQISPPCPPIEPNI